MKARQIAIAVTSVYTIDPHLRIQSKANSCRRFRLVLKDGTSREAIFRFMKGRGRGMLGTCACSSTG